MVVISTIATYKSIQQFTNGVIVELYERKNYCGDKMTYTSTGDYQVSGIRPSSLRVASGYAVWVYTNWSQSGDYKVLQGDIPNLQDQLGNMYYSQMNDNVYSIKILRLDNSNSGGTLSSVSCPRPTRSYICMLRSVVQTSDGAPLYMPHSFNFNDNVVYTLSLDIYTANTQPHWRNILYHGRDDLWGPGYTLDRTPALWTYPSSPKLHFRHKSSYDLNDGCDIDAPFQRWYNFTVVVSVNFIQLYIDYNLVNTCRLPGGHRYDWGSTSNKRFHIGIDNWGYRTPGVYIQNVFFIPEAMSISDVKYHLKDIDD